MPRINISTPVKFKCQKDCSNCCTVSGGMVLISEKDLKKMSKYLKVSQDEFLVNFTYRKGKYLCLMDKDEKDCIFLKDNRCTIYPVRPIQCRTFPFWPQNVKSEKRWQIISEECPGIGDGRVFLKEDIEDIFNGKSVDSEK